MAREKPKMTVPALLLLLFILSCLCISVGLFVWAWIKPALSPAEVKPVLVSKVVEAELEQWKNVCDAMIIDIIDEKLPWQLTRFPASLLEKIALEPETVKAYCEKQNLSVDKFAILCRSIGNARNFYLEKDRTSPERRSVFPYDFLPESYDGPIPEDDPVFTTQDYRNLNDATLIHNLKFYEQFRDDIDIIIEDLLEPVE